MKKNIKKYKYLIRMNVYCYMLHVGYNLDAGDLATITE